MKLMLSTASVHARIVTVMLLVVLASGTIIRVNAAQPESEAQTALDKIAIMELAARFENTFDAGDVEGHLDTWVDDLSFESPFGNYQGKDAYRTWVTEFNRIAIESGGTRHLVTNFEIDVDDDTATMTCYLVILSVTTPPALGFTTAFTDDQLRRVDGEWKFIHRTLEVDQTLPAMTGTPVAAATLGS